MEDRLLARVKENIPPCHCAGPSGTPVHPGLLSVPLGCRLVFTVKPTARIDFSSLCIWTNYPLHRDEKFHRHVSMWSGRGSAVGEREGCLRAA